MGAGSSGIRAPAPTPEQQRRGMESTIFTPAGSGNIVSSHNATMCHELAEGGLKGCMGLGPNMGGALMMVGARAERNEFNEMIPL